MHRPDHDSAVAVRPATTAAGTPGWFQDGNPAEGIRGTVLQAEFLNDLIANIMAVLAAGAVVPVKGSETDLRDAILAMIAAGTVPTGMLAPFPASAPPSSGWAKANGITVPRTGGWAALWAYAQASGNLVTDAVWLAGRPASFSSGDGATTFRIPDLRGLFVRGYHDGSGTYETATGTQLGEYRDSRNKAHTHSGYVLPSGSNTSSSGSGTAEEGAAPPNMSLQSIGSEGGADAYPRHVTALWCVKL